MTEASKKNLMNLCNTYESPTTDDYFNLKLELLKRQEKERSRQRKEDLERLKKAVRRQQEKKARRSASDRSRSEPPPTYRRLARGRTFNLEFKA